MCPTQGRMQNDHSRGDTRGCKMCLKRIIRVRSPPARIPWTLLLECFRQVARESQVAADTLEDGEDLAIGRFGETPAKREFPIEEPVVLLCTSAHRLIFAENTATCSLKVEAGAIGVIVISSDAMNPCANCLLNTLAEIPENVHCFGHFFPEFRVFR